jgi:hypothetical protein
MQNATICNMTYWYMPNNHITIHVLCTYVHMSWRFLPLWR